uniref:Uncharacterized protein n=1 Tax=Romanomermis culicivorax TaxID=13658 RepID=A0A915KQT2_ROMCU
MIRLASLLVVLCAVCATYASPESQYPEGWWCRYDYDCPSETVCRASKCEPKKG